MSGGSAGSGQIEYPAYLAHIPEEGDSQEGFHYGALLRMRDIVDSYLGWELYGEKTGDDLSDDISPYDGMTAYNPDTALTAVDAGVTALAALASSHSGSSLWSAAVTAADTAGGNMDMLPDVDARLASLVSAARAVLSSQMTTAKSGAATTSLAQVQIAAALNSNSDIAELISAAQDDFEAGLMPAYYRSVNRFTAGMADINAVMSSSFIMGLGQMESQLQQMIAKFSTDMKMQLFNTLSGQYLQLYANLVGVELDTLTKAIGLYTSADDTYAKNRALFITQAVNEIMTANMQGYQLHQVKHQALFEANKLRIIAKKEQTDKDMELDVLDARWPMDLLLQEGNLVANIAGAAHMIDKPVSTAQSAVSGAFSGAAIGSKFGLPGLAAGAALGAAAVFIK